MASSHSTDLTKGPITKNLLFFVTPLLLSSLLQQLYNIADRVVVGQFAENGSAALAAVGTTGEATTLILNLFIGVSVGVNVICANLRGARNQAGLRKCMHSSILLSAILGAILAVVGCLFSGPLMDLISTPDDIKPDAVLYMQIYFLGSPASMVYNFGAAILRAYGDTKRPMYILGLTGLVNVALNLILVIGCGRGVDGVAIATIVAQYLSAIAILRILFSPKYEYRMRFRDLRLHKPQVAKIFSVGIPCGLNSMVFNISNVVIQSAVNSFNSKDVIAGNTAATDITSLFFLVIAAFYSACVSFSGQCYGARRFRRIDKVAVHAVLYCNIIIALLAAVVTVFPRQILSMFNSDPHVIDYGVFKLILCSWTCMLYTVSDVCLGCVRGMGKSAVPTVLNMVVVCGTRLIWTCIVFPLCRTIEFLYLCLPISWLLSALVQLGYFLYCRKKLYPPKETEAEQALQA